MHASAAHVLAMRTLVALTLDGIPQTRQSTLYSHANPVVGQPVSPCCLFHELKHCRMYLTSQWLQVSYSTAGCDVA